MRQHQYVRADTGRTIQTQLLDLLGKRTFQNLDLDVVLGFECFDRIRNAIGLLDVFPYQQLTVCGMRNLSGETHSQ